MSWFRRLQAETAGLGSLFLTITLTFTLTVMLTIMLLLMPGCSRPAGISDSSSASADQHTVPFHDNSGTSNQSRTDNLSPGHDNRPKVETGLPFRDLQSLPAGTLLTVRLKNPISSEDAGAGGVFEAVVDEPVVLDGSSLIPRGAGVAGRVESARVSTVQRNRGYVRLTLDSIDIAGKDLLVQTSSLFARGGPRESSASVSAITLEKGRRLVFRLAEPVNLASQPAPPSGR